VPSTRLVGELLTLTELGKFAPLQRNFETSYRGSYDIHVQHRGIPPRAARVESDRPSRDNVNLQSARVWVRRLKNGLSVDHRIVGDELRTIKRYLGARTDRLSWLFLSERGQPLTRSSVQYLVRVAGESAGLHGVHPSHATALLRLLSCQ
jgi:integrase-like protein